MVFPAAFCAMRRRDAASAAYSMTSSPSRTATVSAAPDALRAADAVRNVSRETFRKRLRIVPARCADRKGDTNSQQSLYRPYGYIRFLQNRPVGCVPYAVRLFQPNVMLQLEVLIIGAKINNALDKSGKLGNAGPAEQKIQNSHSDFAEIELVNTESTEENCKNTGGLLALLRPGGIDGAYINRLRRCLLKHDLLRRRLLKDDLLRRLCLRSGKFFSTESAFRYSRIKRSTTLRTFCCYHERFLPFCLLPVAYIGKTIIQ